MSALSVQYFIKKSFLRSRAASLVGSNRISRRRRTVIGIMIFLYSPFSNACTRTSLAMFQMKENRWLYCAVFIKYKNNHFLRKSTPALSALCVRQSVGLWRRGPKCWLPPARACLVRVLCVSRVCPAVGGRVWCRLCLGRSHRTLRCSCGHGAKMCLAYTTGPFSVPHCPAMASRTTEGPILYDASGTAATEPPLAHR